MGDLPEELKNQPKWIQEAYLQAKEAKEKGVESLSFEDVRYNVARNKLVLTVRRRKLDWGYCGISCRND